jgi:hypothetical protein
MTARAKTGGRQAGTPNKLSSSVKENIVGVFTRMGGVPAMVKWAEENPTQFYQIYAKLLPVDVDANVTGNITLSLSNQDADL